MRQRAVRACKIDRRRPRQDGSAGHFPSRRPVLAQQQQQKQEQQQQAKIYFNDLFSGYIDLC